MNKNNECIIDFESVVTKEELRQISEEERAIIEKESTYHYNYLRNMYSGNFFIDILTNRAREIAFISSKYKNLSKPAKDCLAAKIAFNNDEKFIKCLLSKNITYNQLFAYARAISGVKKVVSLANKLEVDDVVKVTSKKLNNLCSLIRMYFGIRDYNLILAKINEIIVFKKELYKKLEQEQLESCLKTR